MDEVFGRSKVRTPAGRLDWWRSTPRRVCASAIGSVFRRERLRRGAIRRNSRRADAAPGAGQAHDGAPDCPGNTPANRLAGWRPAAGRSLWLVPCQKLPMAAELVLRCGTSRSTADQALLKMTCLRPPRGATSIFCRAGGLALAEAAAPATAADDDLRNAPARTQSNAALLELPSTEDQQAVEGPVPSVATHTAPEKKSAPGERTGV